MSDLRPGWISREQRDRLEERLRLIGRGCSTESDVLEVIVDAWDMAPADAADAIAKAIRDYWGYENSCSDEKYVPLVLRALGYPEDVPYEDADQRLGGHDA